MNAISHLKHCHKKELPETKLQQDVNHLLEDLKAWIVNEESKDGDFLSSYEIDVDLVLSERQSRQSFENKRKNLPVQSKIHAHASGLKSPYRELKNGGRVFENGGHKRSADLKISFEHLLASFVKNFRF
ncbi:MAG: hypothetical protein AAB706_01400 [Patescibacteria group bacterium]